MGVKPNRQGWCGPQRSEDTALSILFQGKEAETPSPSKKCWGASRLLSIFAVQFFDNSIKTGPEQWFKLTSHHRTIGG